MELIVATKNQAERREKSSEHLRLVLPLLSKHGSDFSPESYAVWFSYVSGERPILVQALEPLVAAEARLTMEQTHALYCQHLRDAEAQALETLQSGFIQLLANVASSTSEAQAAANLAHGSIKELAVPSPRQLAEQTQLMLTSLQRFGQQLDSAKVEINELRDELHSVRNEARTDALTSLRNRRAFDEALLHHTKAARSGETDLCLIMIDVDHFKRFNDEMGHVMGDKALQTVAKVIQQNIAAGDNAARYGGEEFAVLLAGQSLPNAVRVAENLRQAVERVRVRKSSTGEVIRSVTISCGVTAFRPADEPTDFVDRADGALYLAKEAGRNRIMVANA
jgi:diguanylate cyclase